MLAPFIIIGVGGSGGKTLRTLRQTLLRRLRSKGWTDDLPTGWQFLEIDTISKQSGDGFPAPVLPPNQYLGLVPTGVDYTGLKEGTIQRVNQQDQLISLGGWLPQATPVPIETGAGQFRTLGRAVVVSQLQRVAARLNQAHQALTAPGVEGQLKEAARLLNGKAEGAMPAPIAIIVSSIAGGSGAGIYLDIVEALKSIDSGYYSRTHTFLYGPDVFNSVPAGMRDSIPANALGSINENIAGLWAEGPGEGSSVLFRSAGLIGQGTRGFGPKHTYLVGSSNGQASFQTQHSVYHATGESLATLVADDKVQEWMTNFIMTNVFVNSANSIICQDNSRLKSDSNVFHMQPLAAIGVARVSLGLERFTEYIAEGMARASVEQLLWPQFAPQDPYDTRTPQQLVEDAASREWSNFLRESGLNERGEDNDVINALASADLSERTKAFAQKALTFAEQGVDAVGLPIDQWVSRLTNFFALKQKEYETDELAEAQKMAQQWVTSIQQQLLTLVSKTAARRDLGLNVTATLIERLRDEVRFVAQQELPVEANRERRKLDQLASKITEALPVGMQKIPTKDMRDKTATILQRAASFIPNAITREIAQELLADLDENFLRPLETAIKNTRSELSIRATAQKAANGDPNPFPNFANIPSGTIPAKFEASEIERLLIPVTSYPTELDRLVQESLPESERSNWWSRLVERMTLGTFLDQRGDEQIPALISVTSPWVPQNAQLRPVTGGAQRGQFSLPVDPMHFIDRHMTWLADPVTNLGKFLVQDLVQYLTHPDPAVQSRRRSAFQNAFSDALKLSAPLCALNQGLIGQVHPNVLAKGARYLKLSTIPFVNQGELKDLYDIAANEMQSAKVWDPLNSPNSFDLVGGVQQIDMFSTIASAMNPMVFTSLMQDIAEKWSKNNTSQTLIKGFWTNRRARPLIEAIPAAPEVVASMVRGWFIANLFNQRKAVATQQQGPKVSIWDPSARGYLDFPFPLLPLKNPAPTNNPELLAGVIKSLALALVDCHTRSNLEPLKPYWRLMDLGNQFGTLIENWCREGKLESDAPAPDQSIAGSENSTFEERKNAVHQTLTKTSDAFEAIFKDVERGNDIFNINKIWELRGYIRTSLAELTEFVNNLTSNEGALM